MKKKSQMNVSTSQEFHLSNKIVKRYNLHSTTSMNVYIECSKFHNTTSSDKERHKYLYALKGVTILKYDSRNTSKMKTSTD